MSSDFEFRKQNMESAAPGGYSRRVPPFHVVLLDDNEHTYEYVIDMLRRVFGYTTETALQLAATIGREGRVIVDTTTFERAEFKRNQIHDFGPDFRIPRSKGAMCAIIKPASC
ncbi:MAG: ATP-dependent Clp protease adaptor ClpS [Phycisphaerales bacterium]|nr:ATP-dependent Clp protease adaptor ClpS [Phycisphaerales bacterium]